MIFTSALKRRTGWKCKKIELALRRLALTLDNISDNISHLVNPLCFLPFDDKMSQDLDILLAVCTVPRPLPYKYLFLEMNDYHLEKISEGAYGQVYRIKRHNQEQRIIKIVVAYGFHHDNPRHRMTVEEVLPDAVCSRYLSTLRKSECYQAPNFPIVHRIDLADGRPPECILNAWREYKLDPNNFTSGKRLEGYSVTSLYVIMELEHCGDAFIEQVVMRFEEAMGVFLQTASALAVAEEAFQFEHRDLHGGNLLFKETSDEYLEYRTKNRTWKVATHNVQAFIIDFTMSRISTENDVIAMDMSNFEYEREILPPYDFADHSIIYGLEDPFIRDDFKTFAPSTNLLWLRHLAEHLHDKFDYICDHYEVELYDMFVHRLMGGLRRRILNYDSTMEFLEHEVFNNPNYAEFIP